MVAKHLSFLVIVFSLILTGCTYITEVITSEPSGADIYWGPSQAKMAKTGYQTPYEEKALKYWYVFGNTSYQVKMEGYEDSAIVSEKLTYEDRRVHFELSPLARKPGTGPRYGAVIVLSDPPGADVFDDLGRQYVGRTPTDPQLVQCPSVDGVEKRYTIQREGLAPQRKSVTVKCGADTQQQARASAQQVFVRLQPPAIVDYQQHIIAVVSKPDRVAVSINGAYMGKTPFMLRSFWPNRGQRVALQFSKPGFAPEIVTTRLKQDINVVMQPTP